MIAPQPENWGLDGTLDDWSRNCSAAAAGDALANEMRLTVAADTFLELSAAFHNADKHQIAKSYYSNRGISDSADGFTERLVSEARQVRAVLVGELLGHSFRPVPGAIGDVPRMIDCLIFAPGDPPASTTADKGTSIESNRPNFGALRTLHVDNANSENHFLVGLAGRLYLPQYRYLRMLRAVRASGLVNFYAWAPLLAGVLTACLVPIGLAWLGSEHLLMLGGVGLGAYACIAVAVFIQPVGLSQLAMLRIPATTMLGIVGVIGWGGGAVSRERDHELVVAGIVALLIIGYLALEARMHGARRGMALTGGLIVGVIGLVGATVLMTTCLAFVYPLVHGSLEEPVGWARIVLLGTVSMALGLLLQILWDDKPATSPLSHLDAPLESTARPKKERN